MTKENNKKLQVRKIGVPAEIKTKHLLDTYPKLYNCINLLDPNTGQSIMAWANLHGSAFAFSATICGK